MNTIEAIIQVSHSLSQVVVVLPPTMQAIEDMMTAIHPSKLFSNKVIVYEILKKKKEKKLFILYKRINYLFSKNFVTLLQILKIFGYSFLRKVFFFLDLSESANLRFLNTTSSCTS